MQWPTYGRLSPLRSGSGMDFLRGLPRCRCSASRENVLSTATSFQLGATVSDAAERFIAAATEPLADNAELHLDVRMDLNARIENARETNRSGDALEVCADRLESKKISRGIWQWLLLVVVLASLGDFGDGKQWNPRRILNSMQGEIGAVSLPKNVVMGEEQALLMAAASNAKQLSQLFPRDPIYYAHYVREVAGHKRLPSDFEEIVAQIDPENGWFDAVACQIAAEKAVAKGKSPQGVSKDEGKFKVIYYTIKDPAEFERALAHLHRSVAKPKYQSYHSELAGRVIHAMREPKDYRGQMSLIAATSHQKISTRALDIAKLIAAAANQYAENNDSEGLRTLIHDWRKFAERGVGENSPNVIEALLGVTSLTATVPNLHAAALKLGLPSEVAELSRTLEAMKNSPVFREMPKTKDTSANHLAAKGSIMVGLSFSSLDRWKLVPLPTADELKPSRLVEQAMGNAVMTVTAARWLLLLAGVVVLSRYRFNTSVKKLSNSLLRLLRPADWLWLFFLGVIAPIALQQFVYRLTPLGGRDWGMMHSRLVTMGGQFTSLLVLLLLVPVLVARWRLRKRGAAIGLVADRSWAIWAAVAFALLGMLLVGAVPHWNEKPMYYACGAVLAAPLFVMLGNAIVSLTGNVEHTLGRAMINRILVPVYLCSALALSFLLPIYRAEERYWVARDELMTPTPESPVVSQYEAKVARAMNAQLRRILEVR